MKKLFSLLHLSLLCLSLPLAAQKLNLSDSKMTALDQWLEAAASHGYSGALLIAQGEELKLAKGYGLADDRAKLAIDPHTSFNIGSVSKQFTAAAILKLREMGLVHLDDSLGQYFLELPHPKGQITLHQLLTHSSGISPQTGGYRYDPAPADRLLDDFRKTPLQQAPGEKHHYANANYILLALIIEMQSKSSYEDFLRLHFWEPLQMKETFYRKPGVGTRLARAYSFNSMDGEWQDRGYTGQHLPPPDLHYYSLGKGDLHSSLHDLFIWHRALMDHKVLTAESRQLLEEGYVYESLAERSKYAYGWAIIEHPKAGKIATHNGSNGIFFADFIRFVDEDVVIINLSNRMLHRASTQVAWTAARSLIDSSFQAPPMPAPPEAIIHQFMAHYPLSAKDSLTSYLAEAGYPLRNPALLNRMGMSLIYHSELKQWALPLLQLNVDLFPEDGNLWDSLGDAYFKQGQPKSAEGAYQKALELAPDAQCHWCGNSRARLQQIQSNN